MAGDRDGSANLAYGDTPYVIDSQSRRQGADGG